MAKQTGYTFTVATRNPKQTFVFCKWYTTQQEAIDFAVGELKDRSEYDVDFILIREGTNTAKDPVIWDSRKNYVPVLVKSPIRLKIEELYQQNNYDTQTFEELIQVLDTQEKGQ